MAERLIACIDCDGPHCPKTVGERIDLDAGHGAEAVHAALAVVRQRAAGEGWKIGEEPGQPDFCPECAADRRAAALNRMAGLDD